MMMTMITTFQSSTCERVYDDDDDDDDDGNDISEFQVRAGL